MNALFEEFSASIAQSWKERLAKDLKGITFEDLSVQDRNGMNIWPFYTAENESSIDKPIFHHKDWTIFSAINVVDEKNANAKALMELESGASGLVFIINKNVQLELLLQGIQIQYIQTRFVVAPQVLDFKELWQQYLSAQNLSDIQAIIINDVIARSLKTDEWDVKKDKVIWLNEFNSTLSIDATLYQNAGASSAYQIACTLAHANEYLTWLSETNDIIELKEINISIATGTDFFEEIAKLRALRIAITNLAVAYNLNVQVCLHGESSDTYRSPFDAYSNLLRDAISGMAAVLGGCDSLLIHHFDQNKNEETSLSKRMSRNQQLILKEESYFNQFADAASGSFYLEHLTQQLAQKAWEQFKEIEKNGGIIAAKEVVKDEIEQQAYQWIEEYKSGKKVLIGVNKFINGDDKPQPFYTEKQKGIQTVSLTEYLTQ